LNIGPSLWLGRDAFGEAISHIPATLEIAIPASIIGTTIGSVFGILSGRRPDSVFARVVNVFSFVLISAADFWVGVMAILIFAVWLRLLPAGGSNGISSAILPIAVLSLRPLAHATQVMSTSVAEEMQKDYVLTARAKGMSERRSMLRHVARNAALLAGRETREIRERLPNTRVLAGRPGDTLSRLRELARAPQDPGGQ
jgi:peptide/nickel transport system permease protein